MDAHLPVGYIQTMTRKTVRTVMRVMSALVAMKLPIWDAIVIATVSQPLLQYPAYNSRSDRVTVTRSDCDKRICNEWLWSSI